MQARNCQGSRRACLTAQESTRQVPAEWPPLATALPGVPASWRIRASTGAGARLLPGDGSAKRAAIVGPRASRSDVGTRRATSCGEAASACRSRPTSGSASTTRSVDAVSSATSRSATGTTPRARARLLRSITTTPLSPTPRRQECRPTARCAFRSVVCCVRIPATDCSCGTGRPAASLVRRTTFGRCRHSTFSEATSMARPRDLLLPDPRLVLDQLRDFAPQCDVPVEGADALVAWLHRHGFRRRDGSPLSWRQVLDIERRVGESLHLNRPAIGVHPGAPWSTHLLLLRWCLANGHKLGPPGSPSWMPAPRTLRARRRRRS